MVTSVRRSPTGSNPRFIADSVVPQRLYYSTNAPRKIHGRSFLDSLRFYFLVKPQHLVRLVLFVVVAICSLSLAFRLHATAISQSNTMHSSLQASNRVLFQKPPELETLKLHMAEATPSKTDANELFLHAGYSAKPRVVGYYWPSDYEEEEERTGHSLEAEGANSKASGPVALEYEQLDPNLIRPLTDRSIHVSKSSMKAQIKLEDSKSYDGNLRDDFEPGDCEAQYEWQKTSFPTCNAVHEQALGQMRHKDRSRVKFLANGYWRDVWMVRDYDWGLVAMKTIRYMHDYVDRNYDRHRRDAVAMERMTSSPNVVDIYSFCGNSGHFEFASGGSLEDAIFYSEEPDWNSTERMIVAYQAASGLADLHNSDVEGRASIAHTDITPSQFVFVNSVGRFLLNDFNRCRFISWDKKRDKACTFHVGSNPGNFRSPEEYRYDLESEKVDVYSLGNIYYAIMMKEYPFEKMSKKKAQQKIMNGERPALSAEYTNSTDQFTQALIKAMKMCWIHNPEERASAREVEQYLDAELTRLGVNGKEA